MVVVVVGGGVGCRWGASSGLSGVAGEVAVGGVVVVERRAGVVAVVVAVTMLVPVVVVAVVVTTVVAAGIVASVFVVVGIVVGIAE